MIGPGAAFRAALGPGVGLVGVTPGGISAWISGESAGMSGRPGKRGVVVGVGVVDADSLSPAAGSVAAAAARTAEAAESAEAAALIAELPVLMPVVYGSWPEGMTPFLYAVDHMITFAA
jgi:hypothetical protein